MHLTLTMLTFGVTSNYHSNQ